MTLCNVQQSIVIRAWDERGDVASEVESRTEGGIRKAIENIARDIADDAVRENGVGGTRTRSSGSQPRIALIDQDGDCAIDHGAVIIGGCPAESSTRKMRSRHTRKKNC